MSSSIFFKTTVSNLPIGDYTKHRINRRNRPLDRAYPYVYIDGIWLKRNWAGKVRAVSVLVTIGVPDDGNREILGIVKVAKEDKEGLLGFLR